MLKSFFFILHNLEPPETDLICHFRAKFRRLLARCYNIVTYVPLCDGKGSGVALRDSDEQSSLSSSVGLLAAGVLVSSHPGRTAPGLGRQSRRISAS